MKAELTSPQVVPRPAEVAAKIPRNTGTVTDLGTAALFAFCIGFGAFAFGCLGGTSGAPVVPLTCKYGQDFPLLHVPSL